MVIIKEESRRQGGFLQVFLVLVKLKKEIGGGSQTKYKETEDVIVNMDRDQTENCYISVKNTIEKNQGVSKLYFSTFEQ